MYINLADYSEINTGILIASMERKITGFSVYKGLNLLLTISEYDEVIIVGSNFNITVTFFEKSKRLDFVNMIEKYMRYDENENPEYFV